MWHHLVFHSIVITVCGKLLLGARHLLRSNGQGSRRNWWTRKAAEVSLTSTLDSPEMSHHTWFLMRNSIGNSHMCVEDFFLALMFVSCYGGIHFFFSAESLDHGKSFFRQFKLSYQFINSHVLKKTMRPVEPMKRIWIRSEKIYSLQNIIIHVRKSLKYAFEFEKLTMRRSIV